MPRTSLLVLPLSLFLLALNAARVIPGNSEHENSTFTFGIGSFVMGSKGDIYVAAQVQDGGQEKIKEFAVSKLLLIDSKFRGITPEKTTLNITQLDQQNPLYDRGIRQLALMHIDQQDLPAVVVDNKPNQIILFEHTQSSGSSLLITEPIKDAQGEPAQQLFGLVANDAGYLFSVTQPNNGQMGDQGTGIATIVRGFTGQEQNKMRVFRQISVSSNGGALPFDKNSAQITLTTDPIAAMNNPILHWDNTLQRLFIGISVTTANTANAGARAIAVGRIVNGHLQLTAIGPDTLFTSDTNDLLIGVRGADQQATIFDITTLHTTTNLAYLVVLAGTEDNKQLRVFPLVHSVTDDALTGTLAAQSAVPEKLAVTTSNNIPLVVSTLLPQAAQLPTDIALPTDPAARIGADVQLPGSIEALLVETDGVFVSVVNASDSTLNGVYRSQALFDNLGRIASWTRWQRAYAPDVPVFFGAARMQDATYFAATGTDTTHVNTVTQTAWQDAQTTSLASLNTLVNNTVQSSQKNISSVVELVPNTPGLQNIALLAIGLYNQLMLAQIAQQVDDVTRITPAQDFATIQQFNHGVIDQPVQATVLNLSGGELEKIGFISHTAVARNQTTDDAWLVVSGTGGIAILADENGKGWSATQGLTSQFGNIGPSSFHFFATNEPVKKVIADANFLYLLTDTQLLRATITPQAIAQKRLNFSAVATTAGLFANSVRGFTDIVISQERALLGTTNGLYQNLPGTNIQTVQNNNSWAEIVLPESSTSVEQLVPISVSGVPTDVARFNSGMVLVLTADAGADQARVHRLSIMNNQINLLDDRRILTVPSHFIDYAVFARWFATDGVLMGTAFDQAEKQFVRANFLLSEPYGNNPFIGIAQRTVTNALEIADHSTAFIPLTSRGSWLIAGTDRLYLNE